MLSFAQPWFLLALGGLVIPILIHRISRARPIAWPFPSIARIRKTPLPRQGNRAISDWLLLLLRMLLLALLILALAGPSWIPDGTDAVDVSGQPAEGVIVLDYSSSLSGWNALAETRQILEELNRDSATRWQWIVASDRIIAESEGPEAGLSTLGEFLDQSAPTMASLDAGMAIRRGLALLDSTTQVPQLHVISDFQETDWNETLPVVPDSVDLTLHRVGTLDRDRNLAFRDVRTVPTGGERLRIIARVMNFGREPVDTTIYLETAESRYQQAARIDPGSPVPVAFEIPRPTGDPRASVEFSGPDTDPYARDDKLVFNAAPPPPMDVLALNTGTPGEADEEIFFIEQALSTASRDEWIGYSVLSVGLDPINPETLRRTAAVIIPANAFGDPAVPWDTLRAFIEDGGLVLATMGNDAVRGFQALRTSGYSAGNYNGLAGRGRGDRFYVGAIPDKSPLAAVFEGPSARDLTLMDLRQYIRFTPHEQAEVFLQTESTDPLLLRIPMGNGSLVMSAFPWNRFSSDFPLRPSFLPVVREVFALARPHTSLNLPERNPATRAPFGESVTSFVDPRQVQSRLRGGINDSSRTPNTGPIAQSASASGVPLGPWILLIGLISLIAESLLARALLQKT